MPRRERVRMLTRRRVQTSDNLRLACGHHESDQCDCEYDGQLAECEAQIEAWYRRNTNALTVGWVTPTCPPGLRAVADEVAQEGLSAMIDDPVHWSTLVRRFYAVMAFPDDA